MTFFFFGSAERQLFGAYHASHASVAERGAAVLCPPWGPEYIASHREANYPDLGQRHQTLGTVWLFYTLLGDTRFGAVEWRSNTNAP